jgi:hypothetical protein
MLKDTDDQDAEQAARRTGAGEVVDQDRLDRLTFLRRVLAESRDRLHEIEGEMYGAERDENPGLMVRLRDERDELELKMDPLEAEIYDLEYRRPPRPTSPRH